MARAIQMNAYGSPDVLRLSEVRLPPVAANEVRFRVLAAAVNRADIEIRSGNWPIIASEPFPYTPGLEALGDVVEVGSAVTQVGAGDRVITMMQRLAGIHGLRPGGYQEFVTVPADTIALVPKHSDRGRPRRNRRRWLGSRHDRSCARRAGGGDHILTQQRCVFAQHRCRRDC
jgi:NADPH2:quinone reductase